MQESIRPLGFGETLDGAFTLLRRHFSVFFATALVPQLPVILFWLVGPAVIGPVENGSTYLEAASLLLSPYSLFVAILVMGALTHAAAAAYKGAQPGVGASLKRGLRKFLPLAVVSMIVWFMMVVGLLLLIVPGLIVAAMYFAVYPGVMIENRGPLEALGRSRRLSRGARGRILALIVVAWLITLLPVIGLWMFAGVSVGAGAAIGAATVTGTSLWMAGLMQAGSIMVSAVTWPFLLIVTVLLYYDRLARTEAPDLESAMAALQDNAV
jgi:hypothetical protein